MAQKTANRESIIDLLKGICILLVCFTHFAWKDAQRRMLLFPWWVDMAVPVFMVLSGYVYEKSLERRNAVNLSQLFAPSEMLKKAMRLTVPVLITYVLTLIWDATQNSEIPYDIFLTFLRGGRGQGAYYYPVMMQTILVLPVIGIVVKRYEERGLLLCLIVNLLYEILHVAYYIPVESYRLLMFRYTFVLAAGCYIALGKKVPLKMPAAMFCCGALFLGAFLYAGYEPRYLIHWTGTSFLASMYIVPVAWFLIRKCKLHFAPVEFLGKASYHIFVMQMLYYYTVDSYVYGYIQNRKIQLLISMVCCVCSGVLLYFVEMPLTRFLQKRIAGKIENKKAGLV